MKTTTSGTGTVGTEKQDAANSAETRRPVRRNAGTRLAGKHGRGQKDVLPRCRHPASLLPVSSPVLDVTFKI